MILVKILKYVIAISLICFFLFWGADKCCPLNLNRYQNTSVVIMANNMPVHVFLSPDEKWRMLTVTKDVPALYIKTLLAKEDKYYYAHFGINPIALMRGAVQWMRYGHIVSGGSTISMQTARLLEPRQRKITSKLIECFRALQLEWHFSKEEILNIYLTLAPFGGNIEGLNAASLAFFKKPPSQINPAEIALLVALVQSPSRLQPDDYPEKAKLARNDLLNFMLKKRLISFEQAKLNAQRPLPKSRAKPPREIPHLSFRLKKQFPNLETIHTTIDLNLQKQVEFLLKRYPLLPKDSNAAILIVDHVQNKPLVYVASCDFYEEVNHGFIDYISAYRSPGSTLKPFIYALAFDLGLINRETYLLDERRRFGAYFPHNFDRITYGVVTSEEALARSLNIPVVNLLNQVGVIRFLGLLKKADATPQFPASFDSPSLSVALGGLGMTLEQLVVLYSALARQGEHLPLFYLNNEDITEKTRIFSAKTAKQITQILQIKLDDNQFISLKTGTSYGHRDALVIGYDNRYVIGIWIGKPDGASMEGAWASNISVPLLKKVMKILPHDSLLPIETEQKSSLILKKDTKIPQLKSAPLFLFPVNDTLIEIEKENGRYKDLPLMVTGGHRPFTWLIDGKPISKPTWQSKQFWQPNGPGFYTISVVDSLGQLDSVKVELLLS